MRKSLISLTFCLFGLLLAGSVQALTIVDQNLDEARNLAKAENKLLVIDFYTTWCGPCRVFSNEVHDNEEFAAAIAENYIMLKYDAENDTHGLTKKYHVTAYPTFAILTAEMNLVHKTAGYGDPEGYLEFLAEGKEAADNGNYLRGVSQQIDLDYPQMYVDVMINRLPASDEQIEAYWAGVDDRMGEVPFAVISMGMTTEEVMDYYIENLETYRELYGTFDANGVVEGKAMRWLFTAIRTNDAEEWEAAKAFTLQALGEEAGGEILEYAAPRWYSSQGDWAGFADLIDKQIEDEPEAYGMINGVSWQVYEDCDDQAVIERAIEWMRPVIENEPDFATLDTYAWLYFKNEQYDEARRYIEMAIEAGHEEGADVSASEAMLPMLEELDND